MREIRFRAWDKIQEKMCYGLLNERWSPRTMIWLDGRIFSYDERGEKYDKDISDEFILMQCTGLKDKNGNDIYESDVLTPIAYKATKEFNCQIVWYKGMFTFQADDKLHKIYDPLFRSLNRGALAKNEYIILGNIWENPELLEVKTL